MEKVVQSSENKSRPAPLPFVRALKSFTGYLEGTGKSVHTIESYVSDLKTFETFIKEGLGSKDSDLSRLSKFDLDQYHLWLTAMRFRTNTRRRKVLTVRRFLRFLTGRKKFHIDVSKQIAAPYKVERIPETFEVEAFRKKVLTLPHQDILDIRNRVLLLTLLETGCLVSEAVRLRYDSFENVGDGFFLQILGKFERRIEIPMLLYQEVQKLRKVSPRDAAYLFLGFNKFGPLSLYMSDRAAELLIKSYRGHFGDRKLTPRKIRHSIVLFWLKEGRAQAEVKAHLGLKSDYAFKVYAPLLKSTVNTGE